jgi:hypothetical protein
VSRKYTIADMITGYGVAEAVRHYYETYGGDEKERKPLCKVLECRFSSCFYLAEMGAKLLIDRDGGFNK